MSTRDYVIIAQALRESNAPAHVIEHMATVLGANHPGPYSFNRDRFIERATAR